MRFIILTKLKFLRTPFSLTACFSHRGIQSSSFLTSFFHILISTELYYIHIKNVEQKATKRFLVKSPDFRQIFYRCLFFTNCYKDQSVNVGMVATRTRPAQLIFDVTAQSCYSENELSWSGPSCYRCRNSLFDNEAIITRFS